MREQIANIFNGIFLKEKFNYKIGNIGKKDMVEMRNR